MSASRVTEVWLTMFVAPPRSMLINTRGKMLVGCDNEAHSAPCWYCCSQFGSSPQVTETKPSLFVCMCVCLCVRRWEQAERGALHFRGSEKGSWVSQGRESQQGKGTGSSSRTGRPSLAAPSEPSCWSDAVQKQAWWCRRSFIASSKTAKRKKNTREVRLSQLNVRWSETQRWLTARNSTSPRWCQTLSGNCRAPHVAFLTVYVCVRACLHERVKQLSGECVHEVPRTWYIAPVKSF